MQNEQREPQVSPETIREAFPEFCHDVEEFVMSQGGIVTGPQLADWICPWIKARGHRITKKQIRAIESFVLWWALTEPQEVIN